MWVKGILNEDFINYKLPSLFICTAVCSFKCDKESGEQCCQNSSLAEDTGVIVSNDYIIQKRYLANDITKAIVFGGLEPFDQFGEVFNFIRMLRLKYECFDPVVIYTGYNKEEIEQEIYRLSSFPNIIVKFGRFIPHQEKHKDKILGVELASPNQYAEVIS